MASGNGIRIRRRAVADRVAFLQMRQQDPTVSGQYDSGWEITRGHFCFGGRVLLGYGTIATASISTSAPARAGAIASTVTAVRAVQTARLAA